MAAQSSLAKSDHHPLHLLDLPDVVFDHLLNLTPVFDVLKLAISNPSALRRLARARKPIDKPCIDVSFDLNNGRVTTTIMLLDMHRHYTAGWSIVYRGRQNLIGMEKIGNRRVHIGNQPGENINVVFSSTVLQTNANIIELMKQVYRSVIINQITFTGLDFMDLYFNRDDNLWQLLQEFKISKMVDCSFRDVDMAHFQRRFNPSQTLIIDSNCEFKEPIEIKMIEILSSNFFNHEHYTYYQSENLIIGPNFLNGYEVGRFLQMWIGGNFPRLKTLKYVEADEMFITTVLQVQRHAGGERIYRGELGMVDCTNGFDLHALDGTLGTLTFDIQSTLIFVVWR